MTEMQRKYSEMKAEQQYNSDMLAQKQRELEETRRHNAEQERLAKYQADLNAELQRYKTEAEVLIAKANQQIERYKARQTARLTSAQIKKMNADIASSEQSIKKSIADIINAKDKLTQDKALAELSASTKKYETNVKALTGSAVAAALAGFLTKKFLTNKAVADAIPKVQISQAKNSTKQQTLNPNATEGEAGLNGMGTIMMGTVIPTDAMLGLKPVAPMSKEDAKNQEIEASDSMIKSIVGEDIERFETLTNHKMTYYDADLILLVKPAFSDKDELLRFVDAVHQSSDSKGQVTLNTWLALSAAHGADQQKIREIGIKSPLVKGE